MRHKKRTKLEELTADALIEIINIYRESYIEEVGKDIDQEKFEKLKKEKFQNLKK
jgi:hypothetical protein